MTHPTQLLAMEKGKVQLSGHIKGGSKVTGIITLVSRKIKINWWQFTIALLLTILQVIISYSPVSEIWSIVITFTFFLLFVFVLPQVKNTDTVREK